MATDQSQKFVLWTWIIGLMAGVVIAGGSLWMTQQSASLDAIRLAAQKNSERLAAIESRVSERESRLARIEGKIDSLEGKIDDLRKTLGRYNGHFRPN